MKNLQDFWIKNTWFETLFDKTLEYVFISEIGVDFCWRFVYELRHYQSEAFDITLLLTSVSGFILFQN